MNDILWFGARTIYRVEKSNTVVSPNKLYEERIVLISATSFDDALAKGEKEAETYASGAIMTRRNKSNRTNEIAHYVS